MNFLKFERGVIPFFGQGYLAKNTTLSSDVWEGGGENVWEFFGRTLRVKQELIARRMDLKKRGGNGLKHDFLGRFS